MKRSIFYEIFSGYFLITVLFSSLFLFTSLKIIRNYYINTLATNLKNLCFTLEKSIVPFFITDTGMEQMDEYIKSLGRRIRTRITIIKADGTVLADSEKDPKTMENHRERPEVIMAMKDGAGKALRYSETVKQEMLYVAVPIKQEGEIVGIIRSSLFLKDINYLFHTLKVKMIQIVLLIVIFSFLISFALSRGLSYPVKHLVYAAQEVARGNFNIRVTLKTNNELMELANSFNYMTEKIRALFTDLSLKKEELNHIISSLQEGFVVLNQKKKIILCNDSFKDMVGDDAPEGKFLWEVLSSSRLIELINKVLVEKSNVAEEFTLGEKTFFCCITFIKPMNEVSLTFHDITAIKRLEKVKKDFVVNVSHELRTPLTIIKGFVETLEEEIDEKNRHYLEIIKRHTDRLINIVKDLLLLSELEEKNISINITSVDLKALITNLIVLFEKRLKEKGLRLKLELEDVPLIKGDPSKLEQALINLIDNAIKYTDRGEIVISLYDKSEWIEIGIKDTGIGIPASHIDRIFERFYVVNKSRSKKFGGTGLGLSIVKHIVLLHNGKIRVESRLGEGTKFTILLPKT